MEQPVSRDRLVTLVTLDDREHLDLRDHRYVYCTAMLCAKMYTYYVIGVN